MIPTEQLAASFMAGLFSFFAPCLLPLFPTYFTVITGYTFADLYGLTFARIRRQVFIASLFFAFGFSLIFTILGATGFVLGKLLETYLPWLIRASGLFLIFLGLLQIGIFHIQAFRLDFAWNIQRKLSRMGYITAFVTGIAASLSWIPCIGPLLTPILLLAGKSETVIQGALLLFTYSLGLTLPFVIAGLFFPKMVMGFSKYRDRFHALSVIAGLFLIIFGVILFLDKYQLVIERINIFIAPLRGSWSDFFFSKPNL